MSAKSVFNKFTTAREELNASLIEREEEVTLAMTALLCNEHLVFVGDPGTAKSMLCDGLTKFVNGVRFNLLCGKTSQVEDFFGMVNVMKFKEGNYERIIRSSLVDCHIAFLDELFKSSSSILNSTLKVLNERVYRNGSSGDIHCPLRLCIAASNEWPVDAKELSALFDRFLFRKHVRPVFSVEGLARLMFAEDIKTELSVSIDMEELDTAMAASKALTFDSQCSEMIFEIRNKLFSKGIIIGDRRWRKTASALRAHAWLAGNDEVVKDDLEVLSHIWWSHPDQYGAVVDAINEIAKPSGLVVAELYSQANEVYGNCKSSDLAQTVSACKKLTSIARFLEKLESDKATKAYARVAAMVKKLKLATADSL